MTCVIMRMVDGRRGAGGAVAIMMVDGGREGRLQ